MTLSLAVALAVQCIEMSTFTSRDVRIELFTSRVQYSVELRIEYSSSRLIPEVAVNHRVVQNKWTHESSFKFLYKTV